MCCSYTNGALLDLFVQHPSRGQKGKKMYDVWFKPATENHTLHL